MGLTRRFDPAEPVPGWSVRRHLRAYAAGYFPMADEITGEVGWYRPERRAILPVREGEGGLHVPRRVERHLRQRRFRFRADADFASVIRACAEPRGPGDARWIDERIIAMYEHLHVHGHAHSFEAWRRDPESGEETIVGGIYGLSIGSAFFAESMFHAPRPRRPDGASDPLDGTGASSAALVALCRHLDGCGYTLLDVQIANPHTCRFGVVELADRHFQRLLDAAVAVPDRWRAPASRA